MKSKYFIDSHCHIEKAIHRGYLDDWLQNAHKEDVGRVIAVGTSSQDWLLYQKAAREHPEFIAYTVGLHPCNIEMGAWARALDDIGRFFSNGITPVAIGEIGLDYFHLPKDASVAEKLKSEQKEAFSAQLALAAQLACPVVVHSRGAFEDCLSVVDHSGVDWQKVVFHCFAEGPQEMRALNERGGRGSFTGVVTYKNADNVREALLEQGLDRLMIETDAPYLAPVPHRGKPNEPAYISHIAESCARVLSVGIQDIKDVLFDNTVAFFNL